MKNLLLESLRSSVFSSWLILKLVIPLYIIADTLIYFDILQHISFLFTPITSLLHLPPETALALASGMLINVYAAIALAAPLELTAYQWTVLGVFIGVCHSLVVESAILAKLGVSYGYSVLLRIVAAFVAVIPLTLLPSSLFKDIPAPQRSTPTLPDNFMQMLTGSLSDAVVLAIKIIILISLIILAMDLLKAIPVVKKHMERVNTSFSIIVGQLLGITYGATILIRETERGNLSRKDIFFITTFLMVCHSVIEDILLFVIFGANFWVILIVRVFAAIIISYLALACIPRFWSLDRFVKP